MHEEMKVSRPLVTYSTHNHVSKSSDSPKTWQQAYINMHRRILNGSEPQRYLVMVTVEAGFSDRMIGVLTGFMFALLTNRAFQIITYGSLPRFEAAFTAPNIDWSRPKDPDYLINNLKFTYRRVRGYIGNRSYGSNVDTKRYWPMYLINDDAQNSFYSYDNVSNYPLNHSDVETVFMASNRGRIVQLFNNPYHQSALLSMGLRPETAPRTIWNFLFAPNQFVNRAMAREFTALKSTEILKIAINIRVGDHVFSPEGDKKTELEPFLTYFTCASQIESFAKTKNRQVIWYVTSDSLRLRQLAKTRYPDKVLTEENLRYFHGDCGDRNAKSFGGCGKNAQDFSIQMAAGQVLAMSMCNYIVVPGNSGFGFLAAWLGAPWHNVYRLDQMNRSCSQRDYDSIERLSSVWTGM